MNPLSFPKLLVCALLLALPGSFSGAQEGAKGAAPAQAEPAKAIERFHIEAELLFGLEQNSPAVFRVSFFAKNQERQEWAPGFIGLAQTLNENQILVDVGYGGARETLSLTRGERMSAVLKANGCPARGCLLLVRASSAKP